MRVAAILGLCAGGLMVFGVWGMFTDAGGRRYDEMAGMIPFFALVAGGALSLAAAVVWWWRSR